jgi:hypothetical protein
VVSGTFASRYAWRQVARYGERGKQIGRLKGFSRDLFGGKMSDA